MDNDGILDVVLTTYADLYWYKNSGATVATFTRNRVTPVSLGGGTNVFALADMNYDGYLDAVISDNAAKNIRVYLSSGGVLQCAVLVVAGVELHSSVTFAPVCWCWCGCEWLAWLPGVVVVHRVVATRRWRFVVLSSLLLSQRRLRHSPSPTLSCALLPPTAAH